MEHRHHDYVWYYERQNSKGIFLEKKCEITTADITPAHHIHNDHAATQAGRNLRLWKISPASRNIGNNVYTAMGMQPQRFWYRRIAGDHRRDGKAKTYTADVDKTNRRLGNGCRHRVAHCRRGAGTEKQHLSHPAQCLFTGRCRPRASSLGTAPQHHLGTARSFLHRTLAHTVHNAYDFHNMGIRALCCHAPIGSKGCHNAYSHVSGNTHRQAGSITQHSCLCSHNNTVVFIVKHL